MRVTTEIFVSALLRRVFSAGGFGAVVRRGAMEAGAVFLVERGRAGEATLYGPAAQADYDASKPDTRRFSLLLNGDDATVAARLAREEKFDSDIWVVELEPLGAGVAALVEITTP